MNDTFTAGPRSLEFNAPLWTGEDALEALARWIGIALNGPTSQIFEAPLSGRGPMTRYQLGAGNNYWLHQLDAHTYRLDWRYAPRVEIYVAMWLLLRDRVSVEPTSPLPEWATR